MNRFAIHSLALAWLCMICVPCSVAWPESWYYEEGPLRGSLKSGDPLPLYDAAPER